MKVKDDGETISIEFRESGWRRSTFPEPLVTVDHGETGPRRSDGPAGDVVGITFVGPAAVELRKVLR